VYTNDPHSLTRFDLEFGEDSDTSQGYTLVLSQLEKKEDVSYTVNIYSTGPFRFSRTIGSPPHQVELRGAWDPARNAGGPQSRRRFFSNPQVSVFLGYLLVS
jgi:hypothetical protein